MKYKDIPCIKDKAYFIVVGINGSWLYNSLYPYIEEEYFCKNIVEHFESESHVDDWPEIQQHIDDSYDEIMRYRMSRSLEALNE
jgi:hypothetical protein